MGSGKLKLVISISGGGIRGLIPILIIEEIEKRINDNIINYCDLIAGTSTGGIISCILNIKNTDNKPKYKASDVVEIYKNFGKVVFSRSAIRKVLTLDGLIWNKYSNNSLEKLLKQYFTDTKLDNTITRMLIPTYQITNKPYPFFFKTEYAKKPLAKSENPYIWEAARSTSAANSYFKPFKFKDNLTFLDGGVFANNPTMFAYAEAKNAWRNEDIVVLSIGTGENLIGYDYNKIKNWGLLHWALPFFKQTSISADKTVDYIMRAFTNSEYSQDKYYCLQTEIDKISMQMDNASDENILRLENSAKDFILRNNTIIDDICKTLLSKNQK